ncbi:MAG: methyltransferase domain-containing protein [candidate division NC10 bacterium]
MTRPDLTGFLERAIPLGASVIDLGGGVGLATRLAGKRASRVLYVDRSAVNGQMARVECGEFANISYEIGDALETLKARGPFDVALLLHVLGYSDDPVALLRSVREHARCLVVEVPDHESDPLNAIRIGEGRPIYLDQGYCVEYNREGLLACLVMAGWRVREVEARNGAVIACADA